MQMEAETQAGEGEFYVLGQSWSQDPGFHHAACLSRSQPSTPMGALRVPDRAGLAGVGRKSQIGWGRLGLSSQAG
uniref:Macaca fascicularis brain cDNA, clone: QflA-16127 n=1 Tax=Macaca fascicularis TaxID=9541 RepID=I7GB91_MACFA|nr:unnamed protein product [Macaca fascicularis]